MLEVPDEEDAIIRDVTDLSIARGADGTFAFNEGAEQETFS